MMIRSYSQLVPRYLKSNKKTTISMVVSILLAVMLLVSVGMIISTYNSARMEMVQAMYGKYHAGFRGVEDDLVDKLGKFEGISKIGATIIMGDIQLGKYRLEIKGADQNAMDMWNAKPKSGRLPEKDYEIAIEEWMYNKLEYKPQLGEKFKLSYTYKDPNGGKVTQKENEFTLCGIMEDTYDSTMFETGKAYVTVNTVVSQTVKYHRLFEQWFTIKDGLSIDDTLREINKYALTKEHSYDNIINGYRPNIFYLGALRETEAARYVTIFFDIIVAIAVAMLIFNVFSISVLQRKKHYGLLRAIGITQKQLKGMLFYEAFLFGAILIPIGIILGILSTSIILSIIEGIAVIGSVTKQITPFNIIFPACVCMLSIIAAVNSPAKLASKISPIESMTMEDVKINKKSHIQNKASLIGRFIGITGKMAFTNIKRYKKRFIATVIAAGVGIALFVFASYVISSLDPMSMMEDRMRYDYELNISSQMGSNFGYSEEVVTRIQNIPGVKYVNKLKYTGMDYVLNSRYLTSETKAEADNGTNVGVSIIGGAYHIRSQVYGCSDEFIQSLRESIPGGDEKNKAEIFIVQNLNNENFTKIKNGDEVELLYNYLVDGKFKLITKDIKIDYVLEKLPMKLNQLDGYIATFVPYKYLEDNFNVTGYQKIEINVDDGADIGKVEAELQSIADNQVDGQFISYKSELEKWRSIQLQVSAALLSLVLIIVIVGLINTMNTMNMNIIIRKREFGMLRALGLTKREMRGVLLSEAFLYGASSSIAGLFAGYLLTDLVYNLMKRRLELTFYIDFKVVILTFIGAVLLSLFSTLLPLKRATSEDIVGSIQAVE